MSLIDVHTHLAPQIPDAESYAGAKQLFSADALVEYLDQVGFDGALVSVPPPFYRQGKSASETEAWVTQLNTGLLAVTAGNPKLSPLAYLPFDQPEQAIQVIGELGPDPRFAGFTASLSHLSVSMHDDRMREVWKALDAIQAVIFLHPGHSADPRLDDFYLSNLLGNPLETTIAVAQLSFANILETYPNMRIILAHCGGLVGNVVARWDQGVLTHRPDVPTDISLPSTSIRRMWVDSVVHDHLVLHNAIEQFGVDKLVPGSDWPFPMGTTNPVADLNEVGITPEQQRQNLQHLLESK